MPVPPGDSPGDYYYWDLPHLGSELQLQQRANISDPRHQERSHRHHGVLHLRPLVLGLAPSVERYPQKEHEQENQLRQLLEGPLLFLWLWLPLLFLVVKNIARLSTNL